MTSARRPTRTAPLVLLALGALVALVALGTPARAQTAAGGPPLPKPEDRFDVPTGCAVTSFAASPQLYNPTALDVDHRGRVWVTEAVNYRRFRNKGDRRVHGKGDRIVILEDTDGDGRCDRSTVFAQDKDLVAPLGICVIGEHVLVSCSPHALLYTDADGDDVPEKREVLLTGFGGADHDHGLHSFVAGADGYLYFNAGNAGPHRVTDRSGWKLRSGSNYGGGGNRPGLVSDDGRLWIGGIVMRVRPDGTGLRVLAHNFRNPYEVAVDAFGNLFQSDNDDDGNQGCRTSYVMETGNYGYCSEDGRRSWRVDRRPGQSKWTAHWHQEDPGVLPAGAANGGGGPTGVAIYEARGMPGCPPGTVLNCDAGAGVVYGHLPVEAGAGFELRPTTFCAVRKGTGGKRARWFRPSDVVVAPDGAVLIADWFDPGVGGHAAGDRAAFGRILRITGPATKPTKVDLQSDAGLVAALHSPSPNVRGLAQRRLLQRGRAGVLPVLADLVDQPSARRRARDLAFLAQTESREQILALGKSDPDPEVRGSVLRLARLHLQPEAAFKFARALADDPSPAVRREVLLTAAKVPLAACEATLVKIARTLDPADRFAVEAFGEAARNREEEVYSLLLSRIGNQPQKWSARMATLAWRLHPASSTPAFAVRAATPELPRSLRVQAVDALAFIPTAEAARAMADLAHGPEDTRELAAFWSQHRSRNLWSEFPAAAGVSRAGADLLWRSGLMRAGTKSYDVEVFPGQRLWLVVTDGGDGFGCDWADWIAPTFRTDGGPVALTAQKWRRSRTGWGRIGIDKNAGGGPLSIDGTTRLAGIGMHAPGELEYLAPAGARRLVGDVGPDFGGTSQGQATSVEFLIYGARPRAQPKLKAWRQQLLGPQTADAARRAVAAAMANDAAGGKVLLGMCAQGTLPESVRDVVAKSLFKNPDPTVRLQATRYFKLPGLEAVDLPPIPKLAALPGRADRGAAHFQRLCATCHVFGGTGKDIGPELTGIRRKLGRGALLESILNPDAAISFGYENWILETKGGDTVMGFILARGAQVVVKDQTGKLHRIPRAEIANQYQSTNSLMPAALVATLKPQDLADLATFLLTAPKTGMPGKK